MVTDDFEKFISVLGYIYMIFFESPVWQVEWYGNTLYEYFLAVAVFLVLLVSLRVVKMFLMRWLKRIMGRSRNEVDNAVYQVLDTIKPPFYWFISFYVAIRSLEFGAQVQSIIGGILIIWVTFQVIIAIQIFFDYFVENKLKGADDRGKEVVAGIASGISRIILWSLGFLFVLSNIGIDVTSLIAGLGIGGIAIALAAQNVLGDLFSSLAIYFDRPFEVGDFISTGQVSGTVTKVGIKTTRIKALSGEEVIIPNKDLTDSRIQNFKRMTERRVSFTIGVEYDTLQKHMKQIPVILKEIIEKAEDLRFSRAHFKEFGDSALIFEIVYFVESKEFELHMDRQQEVLLAIKGKFAKEGIVMAFPTQTIYAVNQS